MRCVYYQNRSQKLFIIAKLKAVYFLWMDPLIIKGQNVLEKFLNWIKIMYHFFSPFCRCVRCCSKPSPLNLRQTMLTRPRSWFVSATKKKHWRRSPGAPHCKQQTYLSETSKYCPID